MKTYGQTVIENAKAMTTNEASQYISRKMTELDEKYEEAIFLGIDATAINQAIEEIMAYVVGC